MKPNYQSEKQNKHSFSNSSMDETSWIEDICRKESSADRAIPLIISEIEAEPFYYKCVEQINQQLLTIMKNFYKDQVVDVKAFGSAVTTLALKNSDVDIFVNFGEKLPSAPETFVKTLKNKIGKTKIFNEAMAVIARVPVIQCKHVSGISCDVSFLNGLGVCNSNLIKFLVQIDDRIRPLILIIKYLLKKKELIKNNSITSFTLVILVICFLQQLKEPILPSISHLQSLSKDKKKIAFWETAFATDPTLLSPITNKSSIPMLLKQFFEFYSTFEFGLHVISCFSGKTYLKPFFNNVETLPNEYECYKKNVKENPSLKFECIKCMCVQGPFNHSHNLTRSVTYQILQQFQNFCFESKKICEENVKEDGKSSSALFKSLFLNAMSRGEEKNKKIKVNEESVNVSIYMGTKINFLNYNCTEESLRKDWSSFAVARVKDILVKVMKCTVNESSLDNTYNELTLLTKGKILKIFNSELHHFDLVTKKRNKAKLEMKLPENMDLVNQEEMISNFLCDTWLRNIPKISLNFSVVCVLNTNPTCLQLRLNCEDKKKVCKHLAIQVFHFIKSCIPKYFK